MARTAAVVGTATATRNAVNRRQADKNVQAYTQAVNTATTQAKRHRRRSSITSQRRPPQKKM